MNDTSQRSSGVAVASGTPQRWVALAALAFVVAVKARMEERYLMREYSGYAEYASRVGRFVPGVGRLRRPDAARGPSEES